MSRKERDALDELMRNSPLDLGGDVWEQRQIFDEMLSARPQAADVTTIPGSLGGVSVVTIDVAGTSAEDLILYFHGGAYAIGTAASFVGLGVRPRPAGGGPRHLGGLPAGAGTPVSCGA